MRIRPYPITLCLYFLCLSAFHCENNWKGGDSLPSRSFFQINTYPSSLLVSDLSLGFEGGMKRFVFEMAMFTKIKRKVLSGYHFDEGFGAYCFLKGIIFDRRKHQLSIYATYVYRTFAYHEKVVDIGYAFTSPDQRIEAYYRSSRELTFFGPGFGMGNLSRLYKNFFWGTNLSLNICQRNESYVLLEHIKGDEIRNNGQTLTLPYKVNYSWKDLYPSLLLKLSYRIG